MAIPSGKEEKESGYGSIYKVQEATEEEAIEWSLPEWERDTSS